MTIQIGTRLGPYEVTAQLGAGGMGEVYRARDTRLDRDVAIKVLPADSVDDAMSQARFEREMRAIAALNHPNICVIYDVGTYAESAATTPYMVMELLEGETLHQRLVRGPLDVATVIEHGIALADALANAHGRGLIHRDLKPANIFLTARGVPKILDFGLTKASDPTDTATRASGEALTGKGITVGTVSYMSPEQLRGEDIDARSDLFSFGLVLYEMATGRRAFDGATTAVIASAILNQEPFAPRAARPELPPRLEEAILKTLEKDRDNRCQTAADLRADLRRVKRQMGSDTNVSASQTAATPIPASAMRREEPSSSDREIAAGLLRRHPYAILFIGVILIAAAASTVWMVRRSGTQIATEVAARTIEIQPLTFTGDASRGVISPDGKFIAYVRTEGTNQSLWVKQLGLGTEGLKLVTLEAPETFYSLTVTPDSQQIDYLAYSSEVTGGELRRIPAFGGTPRKIESNLWSANGWSPDGQTMAFVRESSSNNQDTQIVLANADGTGERVLATRHGPEFFKTYDFTDRATNRPAWAPDGASLLVAGLSLAPERVANLAEIVVLDGTTGAERSAHPTPCSADLEATWLNSSQWIASHSSVGAALFQLVTLSALTPAPPIGLTRDLANYRGVSLTADRKTAVSWRLEGRSGIWVGDGDGEHSTRVVPETTANPVVFSIDDRDNIMYTSNTDAGRAIWTLSGGTSTPQRITEHGGEPSTNGAHNTIVFNDICDRAGLYRINMDGSGLERIAVGRTLGTALSKNGETAYFVSERKDGLQTLRSVSTTPGKEPPREIFNHFVASNFISISPDGTRLTIPSDKDLPLICDLPDCTSQEFLKVVNEYRYTWTPDGQSFAFLKNDGTNIWIRSIKGGEPRQLTHFTDHTISGFAWSPDGKRLAVSRYTEQSDIVRIRGFQ